MISDNSKLSMIKAAFKERKGMGEDTNALRLFNGFYEGFPGLVVDHYGKTLVIFDHNETESPKKIIRNVVEWAAAESTGMNAVLLKQRQSSDKRKVNGRLISGGQLTDSINEFGVIYALDLQMNQDASFYLDTRELRRWLLDHAAGLSVLNTFAYTGSLGVAAGKGSASLVIQTDLNKRFLELGIQSWKMNDLDPQKCRIIPGDFFRVTGRMRNADRLFDLAILDPPYFSTTEAGRVDLQNDVTRLINKVRPLVAHEGWLIVINNALFLTGEDFMNELQFLCKSPYLSFENIIPVPSDVTGFPNTIVDPPPVNPAPFDHPTKIAILRVYRKDKRK